MPPVAQKVSVLFHDGNGLVIEVLQMSLEHGIGMGSEVTGMLVEAMLHPDDLLLHKMGTA
jgi:hypothetical protein